MAEYIEREKALKLVKALGEPHFELKHDGWNSAIFEAVEGLTALPAADVRPVRHGNWIFDSDDEYVSRYHCNQCNAKIELCNEVYTEPTPNYCSCCGALMDGKSGDTGGE